MPSNSSDTKDDVSFSSEERRLMTHVEKVDVRSQTKATYVSAAFAAVLSFMLLIYGTMPLNKTMILSAVVTSQMAIFITIARLNALRCYSLIQKLQKQSRIEH